MAWFAARRLSLHHSRPRHRGHEHDPYRDPARSARNVGDKTLEGTAQADRAVNFLKSEFPKASARRGCGPMAFPASGRPAGSLAGSNSPSTTLSPAASSTMRSARTAWPIELHDHGRRPCLAARSATTTCITCRSAASRRRTPTMWSLPAAASMRTMAALSSVRVMGPCIAMGAAAAHALDLAGTGSVHQIDMAALGPSPRQSRAQRPAVGVSPATSAPLQRQTR